MAYPYQQSPPPMHAYPGHPPSPQMYYHSPPPQPMMGSFGPPPPMMNQNSYSGFPGYPQPMSQMQQPMQPPPMMQYQSMPQMQQPMMQPMYAPLSPGMAPTQMVSPPRPTFGYGQQLYTLQLRGRKLDRKDIFSPSDAFVTLSSPTGFSQGKKFKKQYESSKKKKKYRDPTKGGKWTVVYKSEVIKNKANPVWKSFEINLQTLCRGNLDMPFLIEVWDWDPNGNHDFIGRSQTTLRELQVMKELQLVNRHRFGFGNIAGLLEVIKCQPA